MTSFEKYIHLSSAKMLENWPENSPLGLEGIPLQTARRCFREAAAVDNTPDAELPDIVVALRNEQRRACEAGFEHFRNIGRFLLELQEITPESEFWDRVERLGQPISREYAEAAIDAALEAE